MGGVMGNASGGSQPPVAMNQMPPGNMAMGGPRLNNPAGKRHVGGGVLYLELHV